MVAGDIKSVIKEVIESVNSDFYHDRMRREIIDRLQYKFDHNIQFVKIRYRDEAYYTSWVNFITEEGKVAPKVYLSVVIDDQFKIVDKTSEIQKDQDFIEILIERLRSGFRENNTKYSSWLLEFIETWNEVREQ